MIDPTDRIAKLIEENNQLQRDMYDVRWRHVHEMQEIKGWAFLLIVIAFILGVFVPA